MSRLKDELAAIQTDADARIERIKADRMLSAEGKAEQIADIRRWSNEKITAITAGELFRARSAAAAERQRLEAAQRYHREGLSLERQSYALQRAQLIAGGGDLDALEAAINDAIANGDSYMVASLRDVLPGLRRQFSGDRTAAFRVIDAAQALAGAADALEPVDIKEARRLVEAAEADERATVDAAANLRFAAEFTGDLGLARTLDAATNEPAPPLVRQTGTRWIEQEAGEAWL